MRTFTKLALAAFASFGFANMASADDVKIGYGANVTIIVCGTCSSSPAREATRPKPVQLAKPVIERKAVEQKPVQRRVVDAKPVPAAVGSVNDIRCLSGGTAMQLKVRWEKPSNGGNCNGFVRASDFAKVAKLAAQGYTKFMIRFEVVHCDSGLAKMPAEVRGDKLVARPWDKTCLPKGQEFTTRTR